MKVVLIKDYPALGQKNQVKEVKDGFALNFLIPGKIAVKATAEQMAMAAEQKAKEVKQATAVKTKKEKWLETLKTIKVVLAAKANDQGHLYSQVNAKMIQEKLIEQFGIDPSVIDFDKDDECFI